MSKDLPICPFCKSDQLATQLDNSCNDGWKRSVRCRNCGASGPRIREGKGSFRAAWMARPIEDSLRSQLAAAQKEAEEREGLMDDMNAAINSAHYYVRNYTNDAKPATHAERILTNMRIRLSSIRAAAKAHSEEAP